MKLETFFERFDQFADTPDAVAKMRALLLELAIRGRLSERRASDYEDSEWLASQESLDLRGSNSPVNHASIFDIPDSWRWATLNDLGDTKPRNDAPDTAACSFVPMALISAEYGKAVQYEERIWGEVKKGYTHFGDGDVVMAKITPCFENGKSALVDNLAGAIGAGTTELHVFRRNSKIIDPRFVILYLKSNGFIERGIPRMTGSAGQKRVPSEYFANSPFPLPPPAEQKRIVAKVGELMALCDRLEAQQEERETQRASLTHAAIARFDEAPTPANLNFLFHPSYSVTPADLRKTILDMAIQGRLVDRVSEDDTPDLLLAEMHKRREALVEAGTIRKPRPLPPVSDSEVPFDIPAAWRWTRWGTICDWITYGFTRPMSHVKNGPPIVTAKNVQDGYLTLERVERADPGEFAKLNAKDLPRKGSLLITKDGTIGRAAIVDTDEPFCINQSVAVLWLESCLLYRPFLLAVIRAPFTQGPMLAAAEGMAIKHLSITDFGKMILPIPPLPEQRRIVARVDQLMGLVDQLEVQLAASEEAAKELLDAVVHELLHPTADVIEFPRSDSDRASQRAAIGCYAIKHLARNLSFGRTMNMKVVYMAQAHIGLPLDLKFERQAAGPWHPWIEEFDTMGQSEGWFTVTQKSIGDGHTKCEYAPKTALKQKAAEAAAVLGEHRAEFDRLLGFFADMKTVDAEIVATLFAAWNDFLIDAKMPTDDEIIREVRENWHQSKERFTPALLQRWLDWMRSHDLTPKGQGPRTRQQLALGLGQASLA